MRRGFFFDFFWVLEVWPSDIDDRGHKDLCGMTGNIALSTIKKIMWKIGVK